MDSTQIQSVRNLGSKALIPNVVLDFVPVSSFKSGDGIRSGFLRSESVLDPVFPLNFVPRSTNVSNPVVNTEIIPGINGSAFSARAVHVSEGQNGKHAALIRGFRVYKPEVTPAAIPRGEDPVTNGFGFTGSKQEVPSGKDPIHNDIPTSGRV
ncbi:uncharacterized protein A4U43_UnF3850 [Asparagus officinalis]|uniref:Uncharacterized protein n=1 Tax=Asparagus officinalis TaxID=4686 RepID=A0A1R3L712_ASPOF|nr:uncharacterized protein A4U43_UnF3850 [Asparagus officinalis]